MKEIDLGRLVRANIAKMKPYSSARDEFKGEARIFLDANESPFSNGFNRYPDPHQVALKRQLSVLKEVAPESIFVGNGSDEAIDLLFRIFCEPGRSNVIVHTPTYGMYAVSAETNDIAVRAVPLDDHYDLNVDGMMQQVDHNTRLIFICSPNNPTGNLLSAERIAFLLSEFDGIVVIDEAYIDFSGQPSWTEWLGEFQNLVVLQTLSKAWGLAGLRLGLAFANTGIIQLMDKVKPPYNINAATQQIVQERLRQVAEKEQWVATILKERSILTEKLLTLPYAKKVHPSHANFLLVKMDHAGKIYQYLTEQGTIVRDRSQVQQCEDCLRISIGTPQENELLMQQLWAYAKDPLY